jgi:glycosyltransferase involved in cell wall biosynthesis
MSDGVSVIICCHNSERLLPETLGHLLSQQFTAPPPPWEVIVIDNGSTDRTAEVARAIWPVDKAVPLRIVHEPELGLTHARLRGIAEAKYEILCFVDDDNRVAPDWIQTVSALAAEHPEVGAFGGQTEAAPESVPPAWFRQFQSYYAVGPQAEKGGDLTDTRGYLWGAGMSLRKRAWQTLIERQFNFVLSDRKGKALSAGGDAELCYALRLAGWRLWYDPQLRLQHYIPESRLRWSYVRKVSRGFGAATAGMDAYLAAMKSRTSSSSSRRESWLWQTLATVRYLLKKPFKLMSAPFSSMEGDADVLQIENMWGRLLELLKNRRRYYANLREVRERLANQLQAIL